MPIKTPLTYLRHRRDQAHVRKPTTHAKVASYGYINPQVASPLFSQLPGEIRRLIYQYALTASPDLTRPFSKHSWHYRPGYTHARSINTSLLRTCRRVYLEVDRLAVSQNEHLIYQPVKHGPPGHSPYLLTFASSSSSSSSSSFKRRGLLKQVQREQIQQVHIFAQQSWLEDWNNQWLHYCQSWSARKHSIGVDGEEHPERLKITIRHTDWWYFLLGENSPLALDPKFEGRAPARIWIPNDEPFMPNSWGSRFKLLKGLKVFELELETLELKKNELDEVVEQAYSWKFPLKDDQVLVCDRNATTYVRWTGSKHFKNPNVGGSDPSVGLHLLQGRGLASSSSSVTASRPATGSRHNSIGSVVIKRQSGKRSGSQSSSAADGGLMMWQTVEMEEELAPEDQLDYYVVTLTYQAQTQEEEAAIDAGDEDEDEERENGMADSAAAATADMPTPPDVPVMTPPAHQGVATRAPWVPSRMGFPTAYG